MGASSAAPVTRRSSRSLLLSGVVLAALHQDFWLWADRGLLLGFLPSGLVYHIGYSLAAAAFWLACIRWAWPSHWEQWAESPPSNREAD